VTTTTDHPGAGGAWPEEPSGVAAHDELAEWESELAGDDALDDAVDALDGAVDDALDDAADEAEDVAPRGRRRLVRYDLLSARGPRQAPLLLLALTAGCVALSLQPAAGLSFVAGLVLLAVLAPLWLTPRTARLLVVLAVAGTTAAGSPALPPEPGILAGAVAALVALLTCTGLVSCAVSRALEAQAATLRERATRRQELQRAAAEHSELAGRLHHRTTHDALTGLLNRSALARRLDEQLAAGESVGVLVADLAGFTAVNDVLGDELGDEALTTIASRLAGAVRDTDSVARLGGDQFAVLLPGLRVDGAGHLGERFAALLREPLALAGQVLPLHSRVGLAVAPPGAGESGRALLRAAEAAARSAVPAGPCVQHRQDRPDALASRLRDEADLVRGLEADELFVLYQPLVSTSTGRIASTEALVRWRHPVRGLVPPNDFIPLAESTGLIVPLGLRVLELACAQLRTWATTSPELSVSVNVSARQLIEPDFVSEVRRVLWSSGVDPARVVLELTESMIMEDGDAALAVLWQLRGLGVRLGLDDFGTGYSSLGRLGDLPLDELKIDKSFVDRLGVQPGDSTGLVTAAVAMGHGLGLEVVAEGVETAEQAAFLRGVGTDLLQGYLLGRPLPAEEVTAMLGKTLLPGTADGAVPGPRVEPPVRPFVPAVLPSLAPQQRR
jgi:diguanylate cyclase